MPYIKSDNRVSPNKVIQLMKDLDIQINGDLNYILFKFCKEAIKPSYANYKNFIGELESCKLEIYRKLVAPYEEIKESENGTV